MIDTNLIYDIPKEVKQAALLVGNYFKENGIDEWALYDICSRNSRNKYYNDGLTTAISLCTEYRYGCNNDIIDNIICGLEASKTDKIRYGKE